MAFRVHFDPEPEFVKPKLEDIAVTTISFPELIDIPSGDVQKTQDTTGSTQSPDSQDKGYQWTSYSLNLSLGDWNDLNQFLSKSGSFFEKVNTVTQIVVELVKLIRFFMSDLKSASAVFKFLVKILVKQVKNIISSLSSTGLYVSFIVPHIDKTHPEFKQLINGGYNEFVAKVNTLCTSDAPDAPQFVSENDKVGGFILGMVGEDSDPSFLSDMLTNFKTLSKFFRFKNPMPSQPGNFTVKSGLYVDTASADKTPKLGIKLTWQDPGTPVSGFAVCRGINKFGKVVNLTADGKKYTVRRLDDPNFTPVEFKVVFGKPRYEYIDFKVEDKKTYYYQVLSTVGSNFLKDDSTASLYSTSSPVGTKILSAKVVNAIPLSELKKYVTLDVNGNPVDSTEEPGQWNSFTVRTFLGDEIDLLLKQLDVLSEKISGIAKTGTDAFDEWLNLIVGKIQYYLDIINLIQQIIQRIMALRLKGTLMLLNLIDEKGGMNHFLDRFNSATVDGDVTQFPKDASQSAKGGISPALNKGVMVGVVVVYGAPYDIKAYYGDLLPEDEAKRMTDTFASSQQALQTLLKLLGLDQ